MKRVTLYTKPGCCLCDDAKAVIERVQSRGSGVPFELELRNILDRAAEFAEYQFAIPVIHVDGQEIARYRLTEEQLTAALAAGTISPP
jgi:glutaredoxin